MLRVIRTQYSGPPSGPGQRFGPTLAAEYLWTEHGHLLPVPTLRRWMVAAGLWSSVRSPRSVHVRRPRRAAFCELMQLGGQLPRPVRGAWAAAIFDVACRGCDPYDARSLRRARARQGGGQSAVGVASRSMASPAGGLHRCADGLYSLNVFDLRTFRVLAVVTNARNIPQWGVREASVADIPAMNALFAEVFRMERPLAHDQWKYGENPFGPPLVVVAEDGNRVVGQYALWPTPLRLGATVYLGAQSLDTMTHPDYQGQGMFTRLASACYEAAAKRDVVAVYGFPNVASYPGFIKRLNFHHALDIRGWTRLLAPAKHPRIPRAVAPLVSLVARMLPAPRDAALRIESAWPTQVAIEALLQQWRAGKGLCRVERSAEWWQYRCGVNSGRSYQCVAAWRDSTLAGLAIWGSDPLSNYPRGLLAELVFDDQATGRGLVSAAIQAARAKGCAVLNTATNDPAVIAVLRSCGFFGLRPVPFIIRQLSSQTLGANVHDPKAWRILGADLDTL